MFIHFVFILHFLCVSHNHRSLLFILNFLFGIHPKCNCNKKYGVIEDLDFVIPKHNILSMKKPGINEESNRNKKKEKPIRRLEL